MHVLQLSNCITIFPHTLTEQISLAVTRLSQSNGYQDSGFRGFPWYFQLAANIES